MRKLLIFDLDDTIFNTKSIGLEPVKTILDSFTEILYQVYTSENVQEIINDVWKIPFDEVCIKYQLPTEIQKEFEDLIQNQDYRFTIQAFEGYQTIASLAFKKVLLTTGFEKLQYSKIEALDIKEDFDKIYIDNPLSIPRRDKFTLLKTILKDFPDYTPIVIGDNVHSEIKAAHQLGLASIQMAHYQQKRSSLATHYCLNFKDLMTYLGRDY